MHYMRARARRDETRRDAANSKSCSQSISQPARQSVRQSVKQTVGLSEMFDMLLESESEAKGCPTMGHEARAGGGGSADWGPCNTSLNA